MTTLFIWTMFLSLSGAFVGLLLLLIHPLTGKYFSKRWNYYIWLLVLARLLIPFSVDADFIKLPDFFTGISAAARDADTDWQTGESSLTTEDNSTAQAPALPAPDTTSGTAAKSPAAASGFRSDAPSAYGSPALQTLLTAAAAIWLLGAASALFIRLYPYRRFVRQIKQTRTPVSDKAVEPIADDLCGRLHIGKKPALYESSAVFSPVTVGLLHPMIVLPAGKQDMTQLPFILRHELIHLSRKDLWYKWLCQLLLCLHWFNPVLYFVSRQINIGCELSCDEAVLSTLTDEDRHAYGNVLLNTAQRRLTCRGSAFSTTLLSGKRDLQNRLDGILHYKKQTRLCFLLSSCTLITAVLLTACSGIHPSIGSRNHTNTVTQDNSTQDSANVLLNSNLSDTGAASLPQKPQDEDKTVGQMYDEAQLLAGEDLQTQWSAASYHMSNRHIGAVDFFLHGSDTILIAYAARDTEIMLDSSFSLSGGAFKIIAVAPDGSVTTVDDTGQRTARVSMKQGRNVLKIVGNQAQLRTLEIDISSVNDSDFERIYYSESEEAAYLNVDRILSGEQTFHSNEFTDIIHYLEDDEVSDFFAALLDLGTPLTPEDICQILIFSDTRRSSEILTEAIAGGLMEAPDSQGIGMLMSYLDDDCRSALFDALPVEAFYDAFLESHFYLDTEQQKSCLNHYLEAGGSLSYDQFSELAFTLDADTAQWLYDRLLYSGRQE